MTKEVEVQKVHAARILGSIHRCGQRHHPPGHMASLPTSDSTASFWHSEPSEFLLGHRTTPVLPTEADIVIVGSGITGTSAARFLAEDARARELNVVMLDAREACWCATGRVC